jgi:AcrR family transcriptional regulator
MFSFSCIGGEHTNIINNLYLLTGQLPATAMTAKKAPDVRKDEIFKAALRCFNQNGYHGTTIDAIAERAGISKGGFYHHFTSKKNLFIELFHTKVNSYFETLQQNVDGITDAADRIQYIVEKSEEVFQQNADVLKFCLEFVTLGLRDNDIKKAVTLFYKNRVNTFTQMLVQGMKSGTLKHVAAEGVARTLYFLSMGFFLTHFTVNIDFDPTIQHSINLKTILDGISTNKPRLTKVKERRAL